LIEYIVSVHHGYLRLSLPVLDRLIEQIVHENLLPIHLMDRLQREFTALADLLDTHVAKEECWLFPKIRHLREPVGEICWACQMDDGLEELMERLAHDNQEALSLFDQIDLCLGDARWTGKGRLVDQLKDDMRELHENFARHAELELHVLFPHVRELLQGQALAV
jgi:iron-sulfur cluster repair protein YtfE (RIC family)